MSWNTSGALQRRVALAVIAALAVNPSIMMAGGPPEAAPSPAAARVGSVMVESEPAGAAVYVDGQLTGQTPLQVSGLSAGDHRVRLVKGGYLENARLVSVGAAAGTVRVRLTRDAGSRPELAAQLGGGGGGGGGGGSKLPLYLALAGGGAVAAVLLLKKDDTPVNQPPTIGAISFAPTTAIVATITTLSVASPADPDGDALTFAWDFGDGTPAGTGASTTHVYTAAATRTVTVTVSDGKGGSVMATGSLVVKSLTGVWSGPLSCCGGQTLNSVVTLTQSGTNLTGTYTDQFVGDAGTVTGTVNATTRQVIFTNSITAFPGQFSFTGTANAAVTTLTGVGNDVSGTSVGPNSPWTMTRP
ncbi:MAG: PEGA domain-containing protein [Vicinamibacterales bacterium]